MKRHILILIPGLGNVDPYIRFITYISEKLRIPLIVHNVGWKEHDQDFLTKIESLLRKILLYRRKGYRVSLLGISAGGSLALIAMKKLKSDVHISVVCYARLKTRYNTLPMQGEILKRFPAHYKLVAYFEKNIEPSMNKKERVRIMTVRPVWDDIVPIKSMILSGADNRKIWLLRHSSLIFALPLLGLTVKRFINRHYYAN